MTRNVPIVLDCIDPHRAARFWAGAVGLQVEAHDAVIRQVLATGQRSPGGYFQAVPEGNHS
jgi:hypothetical protein